MQDSRAPGDATPINGAVTAIQRQTDDVSIIPLSEDLIMQLAELYTDVLFDDVAYETIFLTTGEAKRAALLWLFERRVRLLHARNAKFLLAVRDAPDGQREVVAGVGAIPPTSRLSSLTMLYVAAEWLYTWGWSSFSRLLDLDKRCSSGTINVREGQWELVMMAVTKTLQGRGVGSRLLRELIGLADKAGAPSVLLGTNKPINVTFYQRQGFEVVEEAPVVMSDPRCVPFHRWTMVRSFGRL